MNTSLEKITLHSEGAQAEIYRHGGHVTSWIPSGKLERLFLSAKSEFRPGTAIRGGVPVIFPQFSGLGSLPKHGFARNTLWDVIETAPNRAILQLADNPDTRKIWDYSFTLQLAITIRGERLTLRMSVENTGAHSFTFTGALHTYLRVNDLDHVEIEGLNGRLYRDQTDGGAEKFADKEHLRFVGEVDRLYPDVTHPIVLNEAGSRTRITASGFPDVVVWNPGIEKSNVLADMEPDGYQRFVCIEAAAGSPISVAPGATWIGEQIITAVV